MAQTSVGVSVSGNPEQGETQSLFFRLSTVTMARLPGSQVAGKKGARLCVSDLFLGVPTARQPHRSGTHGCQGRRNSSRDIFTLLPQWLGHLWGSCGERESILVRSGCFSQIPPVGLLGFVLFCFACFAFWLFETGSHYVPGKP